MTKSNRSLVGQMPGWATDCRTEKSWAQIGLVRSNGRLAVHRIVIEDRIGRRQRLLRRRDPGCEAQRGVVLCCRGVTQGAVAMMIDPDDLAHGEDPFIARPFSERHGRIGLVEQGDEARQQVAALQLDDRVGRMLGDGGKGIMEAGEKFIVVILVRHLLERADGRGPDLGRRVEQRQSHQRRNRDIACREAPTPRPSTRPISRLERIDRENLQRPGRRRRIRGIRQRRGPDPERPPVLDEPRDHERAVRKAPNLPRHSREDLGAFGRELAIVASQERQPRQFRTIKHGRVEEPVPAVAMTPRHLGERRRELPIRCCTRWSPTSATRSRAACSSAGVVRRSQSGRGRSCSAARTTRGPLDSSTMKAIDSSQRPSAAAAPTIGQCSVLVRTIR